MAGQAGIYQEAEMHKEPCIILNHLNYTAVLERLAEAPVS